MSLSLAELVKLLPPPPPATPALPTGVAVLDGVLLGGGLPRGRLTEIVGPTGSGKTTLTRAVVESTVAAHGWVAYVDAQRTLDARDWVHLGDAEGVWIIRPRDANRAAWCADVLLRSGAFALVVLDGAPTLTKPAAVRLTRLARESNAALILVGDRTGGASQLGGAVRLLVERPTPGNRRPRPRHSPPITDQREPGTSSPGISSDTPTRTISVRVEKGGTLRTVEVSCAIGVARRLCTHPEVPDRRGVARGPAGGNRRAHARRAASPPTDVAGRGTPAVPPEPTRELRTAVARARALG
ncbi:MAG: RecA protein [Gemmatimonadetes bacterium]|nr:RecA protein [Gemmatimonadota bacterium]